MSNVPRVTNERTFSIIYLSQTSQAEITPANMQVDAKIQVPIQRRTAESEQGRIQRPPADQMVDDSCAEVMSKILVVIIGAFNTDEQILDFPFPKSGTRSSN